MGRRLRLAALFGAVAMVFAFAHASAEETKEPAWIELQDGLKARLLVALEHTPEKGERELIVNFMLSDPKVIEDHVKVLDIADRLFGRVVMVPADTKGFKRAGVNLLISETKTADATVQVYEDFYYARGADAVWLREAGPDAWKTAQDPAAWKAPESETVDLTVGTVYVDFIGEIYGRAGRKTFGIEMRSSKPVSNVQAKYAEIKELWGRIDHAKLKAEGFDFLRVENYGEPRRGRFHVRQMVYLNVERPADGDWPELPETLSNAPLIASLGLGIDDEATQHAGTAVAWAASRAPFVQVAAPREGDGVTAGVGISTRSAGAKTGVRSYLQGK